MPELTHRERCENGGIATRRWRATPAIRALLTRRTREGVFMKTFPRSMPRSILGTAIASILAAPGVVWAQSADATLRGSAPAEAEVTARNVATGLTRRTKANASGSYTLAGL